MAQVKRWPRLAVLAGLAIGLGVGVCPPVEAACPPGGVSPVNYAVIDLNQFSASNASDALGLNARGQVVGQFLNPQLQQNAYFFDGWAMHDLGTLGGHTSTALDINDSGEIVGYSLTGGTDSMGWIHQAFRSDGFTMLSIGSSGSSAGAVNNAGVAVGQMRTENGALHAALYQGEHMTDLGTLDGLNSEALGINERGDVVGTADSHVAETGQHATHAFLYRNGTFFDLGSLGYECRIDGRGDLDCFERSRANDINGPGQIVGYSTTADGFYRAFRITGKSMEDLGTLGGLQSWAYAINDSGQVVGTALTENGADYHAFLYDQGTMYDLNQLVVTPAGHPVIGSARDINNFGQIVGSNVLLNPLYDSITTGTSLVISDTLGRELSFEYWVGENTAPSCQNEPESLTLEVRITPADQGRLPRRLDRWITVTRFPAGCNRSSDWDRFSVSLPKRMCGEPATIQVRIGPAATPSEQIVFLRHIRMH